MKKLTNALASAIIALTAAVTLSEAQTAPEKPTFSITISTPKAEVAFGADVWITMTMTNISEQTIDCSSWAGSDSVNYSYKYEVRDEQGDMPEKFVLSHSHPEIGPSGSSIPCKLEPEKSTKWETWLNRVYLFNRPGKYTIQVSRLAAVKPADGYIKSNTITVTVLPPGEAPPVRQ